MKTLTKLHWLRTEKNDLQKRIEEIDATLGELSNLGSPAISDMPHGTGTGNPTEKYVEKLINLKDKKNQLLIQTLEIEEEIEEEIAEIQDPEIRTLIRKYYIDGMSWNQIARVYYKRNCDGSTPRKKVKNYLEENTMKGSAVL